MLQENNIIRLYKNRKILLRNLVSSMGLMLTLISNSTMILEEL
uniref:Uncharacterized protein n=1 Tax=virus sp. ctBM815 TaxID=2825806 RepID=A0A8S5RJE3_9VIRU|nr:MAG TPA: hypothetical protein [virus sp. ctBM815]DAG45378.1 MAG TPA: hypothetical protein [Caudoviricetes sp.]DAQ64993.1 MAG TPA: hypothetical protein [Bacteriophage sp.]